MRALVSIPANDNRGAVQMTQLAKALLLGGGNRADAEAHAVRMGAPAKVVEAIKSAMPVGRTSDTDLAGLNAAGTISTAFIPFLATSSAFYRLVDAGMLQRIPPRTRIAVVAAKATAWIAGEGKPAPVSRLDIPDLGGLDPVRAHALVVLSNELISSAGSASEATISRELRRAVAEAVDAEFFSLMTDGDTPVIASESMWTGADNMRVDLARLVEAVAPTANSNLLFAGSPDVIRRGATLFGGKDLPELGITGGRILGVEAMAVDALPEGTLALIDGAGIAGDADAITMAAMSEGDVELQDAPTQDATAGTGSQLVSLWQNHLTALMVTARFGAHRARSNAFAMLTDVSWGGELAVS